MPVVAVDVGGQPLLVDVEDVNMPVAGLQSQGELSGVEDTVERLLELQGFIESACTQLYRTLRTATDSIRPDELELQFGIKLGGEAGIPFVAKGTAEANFAITLRWHGQQADAGV